MKTLVKIGAAMSLIAVMMTAGFYNFIKADEHHVIKTDKSYDRTVKTENRTITAAVNEIEMTGPADVVVKRGDVPGIIVKADQRILSKLRTEVNGNVLTIKLDGFNWNSERNEIEVTLPNLQKIAIHGSGNADIQGFKGDKIQISVIGSGDLSFNGEYQQISANLRGSGNVDLGHGKSKNIELELLGSGDLIAKGDTETLTAKINGSGDIDAEGLHADTVSLTMNGSGDTSVYAKKAVTVNLNGSGDVTVHGQPTQRNISKAGPGEVGFH
jgi:Putative auto-transporter adhesin, head GIN domain